MPLYWSTGPRELKSIIKVVIKLTKCKFVSLFFLMLITIFAYGSIASSAAVVDGDDIVRYVDTPTGTILYKGTAINAAPDNGDSVSDEVPSMDTSSNLTPKHKRQHVSKDIPETPVFDSEVPTTARVHKSNNALFIAIGILIVIIGVGVILFIAKSREKK